MKLLTAFYDLEHGQVSYDFITWLVRALMVKAERGCDRLHVVIVPKENGLGGFSRHWGPHDEHATRWRLWHIVIPACALAGATVSLAPSHQWACDLNADSSRDDGSSWWPEGKAHLAKDLVAAARRGETIPVLCATEAAKRYVSGWLANERGRVITLTLRRQENDPARNADREQWNWLRALLGAKGVRVVWLDDTHLALGEGRGYAELDIDLRLALYERADLNIVGNNGPAALLWHSRAAYVRICAGMPADWTSNLGLKQGEQLPWARGYQRLAYQPDTSAAMREEIERWAGAMS